MPQMKNITVKKADGTTDVTFNAITASGGDSSPAVWRVDAADPIPKFRPTIKMVGAFNGPRTARTTRSDGVYPYKDALGNEVGRVMIETRVLAPMQVPDTFVKECVFQHTNFQCNVDVRESFYTGYAPV